MKNQRKMKSMSMAPNYWFGLSAASLSLWLGLSAATLLLSSCISNGDDSDKPFPGTPEALIQKSAAKWKAHAKRSYAIDYGNWSVDGTTTLSCQVEKGVLTGKCLSVYRCCGEDPESTYVDPPYPVPERLLSDFAKNVAQLKYETGVSNDSSLTVVKSVPSSTGKVSIGYHAEFDRQYGFPTQIATLGSALPSAILITRIEFR